ncbi:MAG: hypothetical protein EZS28_018441 [Streblomastix strix]|uniref:Myb-like domain-containing protein n=1 Tax=Streblomastix strix TaxID=222440 RepID=A0A5J4VUK5_9EUKA|nr:MAG: hypothetical protein EZS28_018441 [Streblomastix strix]
MADKKTIQTLRRQISAAMRGHGRNDPIKQQRWARAEHNLGLSDSQSSSSSDSDEIKDPTYQFKLDANEIQSRIFWGEYEDQMLFRAIEKHGKAWSVIQNDQEFAKLHRDQGQIKDRVRILQKQNSIDLNVALKVHQNKMKKQ